MAAFHSLKTPLPDASCSSVTNPQSIMDRDGEKGDSMVQSALVYQHSSSFCTGNIVLAPGASTDPQQSHETEVRSQPTRPINKTNQPINQPNRIE
jgi:hypothetical protein